MSQENPSPEVKTARDLFPMPEDWIALQGGKPRVFRNPSRPHARWIILHVYDEHDDYEHRFQSGLIVETLADNTRGTSRFLINRFQDEFDENDEVIGRTPIQRDIIVPSFMVRANHGEVCNDRSAQAGNVQGYDIVRSQPAYEELIREYQSQGLEELRFGLTPEGSITMYPLPKIRPPRPLAPLAPAAPETQPQ